MTVEVLAVAHILHAQEVDREEDGTRPSQAEGQVAVDILLLTPVGVVFDRRAGCLRLRDMDYCRRNRPLS